MSLPVATPLKASRVLNGGVGGDPQLYFYFPGAIEGVVVEGVNKHRNFQNYVSYSHFHFINSIKCKKLQTTGFD